MGRDGGAREAGFGAQYWCLEFQHGSAPAHHTVQLDEAGGQPGGSLAGIHAEGSC